MVLKLAALAGVGVFVLCGCATMIDGLVDRAMDHAKVRLTEEAREIVHELVDNQPLGAVPEPGAPWEEYLVYFGTVLAGSGLVLVDRRWFHNKRKC
jgi:hypothetical protein